MRQGYGTINRHRSCAAQSGRLQGRPEKEVVVENSRIVLIVGLVVAAVGALAYAQGSDGVELKPGDPAPPFSLPGSDGKTHSLADHKGKTVVLAWFPKAFTGG
jgi:hypothetical protein